MKVSMKFLIVGTALVSTLFAGCKKDSDPTPSTSNTDGLVMIASGYTDAGGIKVNLYSTDSLYSRYTNFLIEVRDWFCRINLCGFLNLQSYLYLGRQRLESFKMG